MIKKHLGIHDLTNASFLQACSTFSVFQLSVVKNKFLEGIRGSV